MRFPPRLDNWICATGVRVCATGVVVLGTLIGGLGLPRGEAAQHSALPGWVQRAEGITAGSGGLTLRQNPHRFVHLATPTGWEAVSNLAVYRGRIYAVASTIYTNHNSADIYRYDPKRGRLRYETHLFSQDAGQPAVYGGRLYYPAEDSRFSAGKGEFYVTNGEQWQWVQARDAPAIHFHAMAAHGGRLFAAAAAWNGLLYASGDGGRRWRLIYSHKTPKGRVTRLNHLITFQGQLYAGGLSQSLQERYLFRLEGDTLRPVDALPPARGVIPLAVHGGALFLRLAGGMAPGIYRFDGDRAARIDLPGAYSITGGLAEGDTLYLIGTTSGGGALLGSTDGRHFEELQRFAGREPVSLIAAQGRLYMGMRRAGGRGEIWVSANAVTEGTLESKPLSTPAELEKLAAFTPPGTFVGIQVSRAGGAFAGPDGTAAGYYDWAQIGKAMAGGAAVRLKIVLRGDRRLTPYLDSSAPMEKPPGLLRPPRTPLPDSAVIEGLRSLDEMTELKSFWDIRPFSRTLADLAISGNPEVSRWIVKRLAQPPSAKMLGIFGGKYQVREGWLLRHSLLMGLALTGRGRVNPAIWEAPFPLRKNPMEKYFSPHEAGVFAAGLFGQGDPATVTSLVGLLGMQNLPRWFKGDVVGALTRITGQRFGYDFARWARWHQQTGQFSSNATNRDPSSD